MFGLTQEAIEIFEFSRRFREEKRAALAEERARMTRRRNKRRRLTRRGFAPDEGNSGSDEPADPSDTPNNNKANESADSSSDSGSEDADRGGNGEEGEEEEEEFVLQTEPPATDIAFLTQPSRQRDRIRQKLYDLKKSDNKDKDVSSLSDEMWSIRMLEAMMNQTFIDSLEPETIAVVPAKSTAATGSQNHQRRLRDSGKEARSQQQQSQIVYWPGMPMRC
ncbi:hypothetical protein BGZ47_009140 [Haplosporangium gracile]|nr:hypothetical protein BGZ47_009140 [Haplosporangium gracile]